ncbi:MAG: hypothetical protein PVF43_01280 [Candidatus Eiseniibacteriota bacterium]
MRLLCGLTLLVLALGGPGCDEDAPARLSSNSRTASLELQPEAIPEGTLEVTSDLTTIRLDLAQIPVLADDSGQPRPFVYEGWLRYLDDVSGSSVNVSMGRFRVDPASGQPYFARGDITLEYTILDGTMAVTAGGDKQSDGAPLGVDLSTGVSFALAIEPDPDPEPGMPTPLRMLTLPPDSLITGHGMATELIMPVDLDFPFAGRFDRLQGTVQVNAITGEYGLIFRGLPFFDREPVGGETDPGLVYQAWFIDDDTTPPRVYNIMRFLPNLAGDAEIRDFLETGDADGDLVPEPLDFERVLISIEPDIILSGQEIGDGIDTATRTDPEQPDSIEHIFPIVAYEAILPDVR